MSCANTRLPWFIEPPRAMLTGRAAKTKFEIQIETKKINRLCVFHQQLTGAENPNVGTLLMRKHYFCGRSVVGQAWMTQLLLAYPDSPQQVSFLPARLGAFLSRRKWDTII